MLLSGHTLLLFCLSIIERAAGEGCKTGPEDHASIGQIAIGDHARSDQMLGAIDQRFGQAGGKAQKGSAGTPPEGLAARLAKPLIDRAELLVASGVVADGDLADAGVIFGTGFAPFTGGPLNYRQTEKQQRVA